MLALSTLGAKMYCILYLQIIHGERNAWIIVKHETWWAVHRIIRRIPARSVWDLIIQNVALSCFDHGTAGQKRYRSFTYESAAIGLWDKQYVRRCTDDSEYVGWNIYLGTDCTGIYRLHWRQFVQLVNGDELKYDSAVDRQTDRNIDW